MTEPIDVSDITLEEIHKLLQDANRAKGLSTDKHYLSGKIFLQILGSGTRGSPSSLYVSTDHSKYLFNCGEGTQRLAHEHHLKLGKLEHVFFTTPTWKNMGGLPGMSLTIQDYGVQKINIHGPKGITQLFNATRKFVLLRDLNVNEATCNDEFKDSCMTIKYVNLIKKHNNDSTDDDSDTLIDDDDNDYYGHEYNLNGKRDGSYSNPPNKYLKFDNENLEIDKIRGCLIYICKLHNKPGGLDKNKLSKIFKIKPGPYCALLKAGYDIKIKEKCKNNDDINSTNYKYIKSSEVCDEDVPGPLFIVLEIPDEDYLDSLIENEILNEYQTNDVLKNQDNYIIHFTKENILINKKYREWMKKFTNNTQHIILNDKNNCYNYEALHRIQHQLTLLDSNIFPMIHDKNFDDDTTDDVLNKIFIDDGLSVYRAKTLNTVNLRPPDGIDSSFVVKIDKNADVKEVCNVDGFEESLEELKKNINNQLSSLKEQPEFPKLLVLGTGSCIPNKVRNTSGLLLRVDEDTSIVIDCGEGTIGQIIRFFGIKEADKVVLSIKAIYVSHLHADHHLGLLGILQERQRLTQEPVYLFAPKQIEPWLKFYHHKFEKIKLTYNLIPNQSLILGFKTIAQSTDDEIQKNLKIKDISTVEVEHCIHAFGVAFTLQDGQKIVYSGDTRPCTSLVELGKNCSLLIHEATMEDNLEFEAKKKMHSTISEAIKIGENMNSKFTLLTHFSQRYSKMPMLPDSSAGFNLSNVGIAFDNMQIKLSQLSLLPLFYPSLGMMFSEFCNMLEKKANQRLAKEQKKTKK
ncbi:hypothetical protein HCN44_000134 [Aphidius gifuensis]|uniref:Zinc phosphodiesterase ELAC protein 2 n=1 Tax=Aphidius gifuensis TaxID=684658 RepID=A0A835CN06_APHGI|nr:ribonuclease Z, mitochondrial-like [Aphidius gifuensis]KAF7990329.1 hypothetical protein HCN44_000134 [Aphidius gifuensis]